jgi:hypothetical protein
LFGFWLLPLREPSEEPQIRAAMRSLLSGQKTEVTFDITLPWSGTGQGGSTAAYNKFSTRMRRIGTETITIGDRSINAVVFERFEQTPNGGATRKHYYDPASAVWVRTSDTVRDGTVLIRGSSVVSVTVP